MTTEERIQELKTEARRLQKEMNYLISNRRNPARFGQLERRQEAIWRQINQLRKEA